MHCAAKIRRADSDLTDLCLQSSDKQHFQVDEDVAYQSVTIRNLTEDTGSDFPVPLPNVDGKTLGKVLEYCNKHRYQAVQPDTLVLSLMLCHRHCGQCVLCSEHDQQVEKAADDHAKRSLEKSMTQWDRDYIKVDQAVLYWVTLAANYLNIKDLL